MCMVNMSKQIVLRFVLSRENVLVATSKRCVKLFSLIFILKFSLYFPISRHLWKHILVSGQERCLPAGGVRR